MFFIFSWESHIYHVSRNLLSWFFRWCNSIVYGDSSSKHNNNLVFHCFCRGTRNWTEWEDGLHLSIQSPTVNIFNYRVSQNKGLFYNTVLQFSFAFFTLFFFIFVIFFYLKRGIGAMMLIFCWNFRFVYLFVICWWYIRFSFAKLPALQLDFFQ